LKTYGGVEVQLYVLLTSAQDGGERPASCPGRFTVRKGLPVPIRYVAGWVTEPVWMRSCRERIPANAGNRTPVAQPVA